MTASAVYPCITVEDLFPEATARNSDPVVITWDRGEVTDNEDNVVRGFPFPDEANNALLPVIGVYPLKPFVTEIKFIEGRFFPVEMIQIFYPSLYSLMERVLKDMPFQALLMVPFFPLSKLSTHEEEFFPWMAVHVTKEEP